MTDLSQSAPKSQRKMSKFLLLVLLFCIPGFLLVMTRFFILRPFSNPSSSNVPNLVVGDYIFVSRLPYYVGDPQRGDIAVFALPSNPEIEYVKRVIGLPGDRAQIKLGRLYLNGEIVDRVPEALPANFPGMGEVQFYRETLPGGRSYVISEVSDSGALDDTDEYLVPEGTYFLLGDNRDNSMDSRILDQIGFVPRANFIGRFAFRYWNSEGVPLVGRPSETY